MSGAEEVSIELADLPAGPLPPTLVSRSAFGADPPPLLPLAHDASGRRPLLSQSAVWQHTPGSALLGLVKNDAEFIAEQIDAFAEVQTSLPRGERRRVVRGDSGTVTSNEVRLGALRCASSVEVG